MLERRNEILAVIPARAGSQGIPGKNVRIFAGKPLLVHAIETAKAATSIQRIIVSTDSEETASAAKESGAEVPFLRPAEFATSESKLADVVSHLLDELKKSEGYEPTHILLLQPTSPLREVEDIENAISLLTSRDADEVVSVTRTENVLMTKDANDELTVVNPDMLASPNRQQLPAYYKFDGSMIYLIKTSVFLKEHSFFAGKVVGYEIPRWRAIDLDEPQDFILGKLIYENRERLAQEIRDFR